MTLPRHNVHTWDTFVAKPVVVTPKTREIIEAIMPYFPQGCQVVTGFQNDEAQLWKVNYHWEYVLFMVDKALAKLQGGPPDAYVGQLTVIRGQLMMNAPTPQRGYRASLIEGSPKDSSPRSQIVARWDTVERAKRDLRLMSPRLKAVAPPTSLWDEVVMYMRPPGTSNHGHEFAVDLQAADLKARPALNQQMERICKALDATYTRDEAGVVHAEFARGVHPPQ